MRKTPMTIHVGRLRDDLATLAERVYPSLIDGPRLIWADDQGCVFSSAPDSRLRVPTSWISGTVTLGQPFEDIEADLRQLADEHPTRWILSD